MDGVNKISDDYISTHDKNFDFDFFNCDFVIAFDKNFIAKKTKDFYNTDNNSIKRFLIYDFDCFKSRRHSFYNNDQMTISIISVRCNMIYEYYINQPMSMCEKKI